MPRLINQFGRKRCQKKRKKWTANFYKSFLLVRMIWPGRFVLMESVHTSKNLKYQQNCRKNLRNPLSFWVFLPPYNSSILAFILDINHSTHRCTRRYELGPFQAYQFTVVIGGDKSYKEICSFKNVFTYQQLLGIFWWKMDRKSFIR